MWFLKFLYRIGNHNSFSSHTWYLIKQDIQWNYCSHVMIGWKRHVIEKPHAFQHGLSLFLYYCTFTTSSSVSQWQTGSTQAIQTDGEAEMWSNDADFIREDLLWIQGISSQLLERDFLHTLAKEKHHPHLTLLCKAFFLQTDCV